MRPTPSEAARAEVEAWDSRNLLPAFIKEDLIARLTPVFEAAQAACTGCMYETATGQKVARPPAHTCRSLALYNERNTLRERAEAAEAALASERQQREHLFVCEFAGWKERAKHAEAERDMWKQKAFDQWLDAGAWQHSEQVASEKFDAAEADVKRLREALGELCSAIDAAGHDVGVYGATYYGAHEALAATELKP